MKRKRLITLLMFFCILAGNAWGESQLYFENNIIEFANTATDPVVADFSGKENLPEPTTPEWTGCYYRQPLLWIADTSNPTVTNLTKMSGVEENDYIITVSTTGDMAIAEGHYKSRTAVETVGSVTRYDYVLNNTELYFTGTSGTIKLTATQPDYIGVTYTASYTISYHMSSTKWSFYSKKLKVGRMKDDGNGGTTESLLHQHASDWTLNTTGGTGEYVYFFNSAIGSYDSGTNVTTYGSASTYVEETDGLLFYAPGGTFGLYNESDSLDAAASDRFVALKEGAEVVIPASYFSGLSNPRIRIKMGRYGAPTSGDHNGLACIDLTITNGKDALGTDITGTGTYTIGGSAWWGAKRDPHQRGEYHFQVQDKTEPFTIKVEHGQWLKLYTIEVYDFTELLTENSVLGTNYQLLTKKNGEAVDNSRASGTYYLHYRGKGEHTRVFTNYTSSDPWTYCPTGTVVCNNSNFSNYNGGETHTYTATEGQFGTFQMRLACYTHYNDYCTDYADRSQAVGYLETKNYPYTWDFTDVATYEGGAGRMGNAEQGTDNYGEGDYIYYGRFNKRYHWHETSSGNYGHRVGVTADGHKITFCGGSQLWYGKTMIPELEGLGFTPSNYSSTYNNTLQILSGTEGIKINQGTTTWWCYRVAVPNVPANGVVYVRVHPERTDEYYNVGYSYGDFDKSTNVEIAFGSTQATTDGTYSALATDGSGDMIYAVPGNATSASSNITLYFNGVTIKKIAVSTDKKTFNAKGWTTESRDHDIDPSLTAEMNGRGIKTYAVTDVNYANKHVTMTDISNAGLMHAATDDSQYACILRNTADNTFEVVNGGFYLFVPDMHDEQGSTTGEGYKLKSYASSMEGSIMKAKVSHAYPADYPNSGDAAEGTPIPYIDGDYTNFAFTYQYYALDGSGNTTGDVQNGPQGFYRIAKDGGYSLGNQGYLPLLTANVGGDVWAGARGFDLSFDDDESGEVTAIEDAKTVDSKTTAKTAVYFSLSGQQLSGKPAKGGIYICNGKKVFIK